MDKLVITGIGVATGLGQTPETVFENLLAEKSAVTESGLPYAPFVAPLREYRPAGARDRSVELALMCTQSAVADAGPGFTPGEGTGLFLSSTKGGMHSLEPCLGGEAFGAFLPDNPVRAVAEKWGIRGIAQNVVAACATGIYAMASAARAVTAGECVNAIAGCTEAALTPLVLSGFSRMGVLTRKGMAPFRKGRDGFAPGEGAAVFILERKKDAQGRRARVYGEIASFGLASSPHHALRLHPSGAEIGRAILTALKKAGLSSREIDAVCVHGTATQNNDQAEAAALYRVFGDRVPCFGVKPGLGHLLGACAAAELMVCLLALRHGALPPTLGCGPMDRACRINISDRPRRPPLGRILSLNFGFGGHIGAVIIGKCA